MNTNTFIEIRGERFALIPEREYLKLIGSAGPEDVAGSDPMDMSDLVDADEFMAQSIGATLKAARQAACLTQAQLAKRLKKSQAMVSSGERGTVEVGISYLRSVLKACNLPENWNPANHASTEATH